LDGFFIDRLEVDVSRYSKCQHEGKCRVELHAEGRNCNATAKPPRLDHLLCRVGPRQQRTGGTTSVFIALGLRTELETTEDDTTEGQRARAR
jgi:hypothetical protein